MGKPKKTNKPGGVTLNNVKKPLVGTKAKYIGLYGANFHCPMCTTSKRTGMVVEHNNKLYCSHTCAEVSA